MAEEHGTLHAFEAIFLCWAAVFFGVWVFPLDVLLKVSLDIVSSVLFVLFGVVYFVVKGKIPSPSKETWQKIRFWYNILVFWFFAGIYFWLNSVVWEFKTINGVQVVTYSDLASLSLSLCGVLDVVYTIWLIKNKNPSKKTRNKNIS